MVEQGQIKWRVSLSLQMRKIRSNKTPENVLEEAYELPEGLKLVQWLIGNQILESLI